MNPIENLKQQMARHQIDVCIIQNPETIGYLTNFYHNPHERLSLLIINRHSTNTLVLPGLDYELAKKQTKHLQLLPHYDHENAFEKMKQTLALNWSQFQISVDKEFMTLQTFEQLSDILPLHSSQYHNASNMIKQLMSFKTKSELEKMEKAGKDADFAIQVIAKSLTDGISEKQLVQHVEKTLFEHGVPQMSFDTMVLSQKNAANPHGVPGNESIRWNEFVLIDLGTMYEGYASDITRTLFFGEKMNQKQETIYNTVLKAHHEAVKQFKIGMSACDLDAIARQIIEEAGFGNYFTHRLGHGIGRNVHEYPSIAANNEQPLEVGMCFSIEPGIYIPDEIGVRIEDCFVVTENGLQSLTHSAYDPYYHAYL